MFLMASFDLFDSGRPSQSALSERFGVRPPPLYVRFCQWCFDQATGDLHKAEMLYWQLLGLESRDVDNTAYGSPIELFSIGNSDGDQIGFVVFAPELGATDYPWIWYQHDGASIGVLARNTPEFFSRALSYALVNNLENEVQIIDSARHLEVTISKEMGQSLGVFGASKYYERKQPRPEIQVQVPVGWRYVPARPEYDGVGVLAPEAWFAPGPHVDDPGRHPRDVAADHGNNRYYASALWHLQTPDGRHDGDYDKWIHDIKLAYTDLGRPQFAARVDRFFED
jgi:hypothetical protein